MVGRWAQWKGYPQKITPVEQTQLVHFVSTSCTWTQDLWFALGPSHDPNFWGWTSVSQASTPCYFCRSASSLGFKGLFLHKKSPDFSSLPRNCRRSPQGQRGQVSAWRTTIIDPSSSQESSFALGHPVTASCTACPTWGRPRVHEAVKFKIPLRKMRIIRRGVASIAFDWKKKLKI